MAIAAAVEFGPSEPTVGVGGTVQYNKPAEQRTCRGCRRMARFDHALSGIERKSKCGIDGRDERRKAGRRRCKPCRRCKVVVGVDAYGRERAACALNQPIEARIDFGVLHDGAVQNDLTLRQRGIERYACMRAQFIERNRQRRCRRHIARPIAFAPVLHQSNVRMWPRRRPPSSP